MHSDFAGNRCQLYGPVFYEVVQIHMAHFFSSAEFIPDDSPKRIFAKACNKKKSRAFLWAGFEKTIFSNGAICKESQMNGIKNLTF